MHYQGIIFDLDGTLLDTLDDLSDAMNSVLEKKGFPLYSTKNYRYLIGKGADHLVKVSLPIEYQETEDIPGLLSLFREEYSRLWDKKTRPFNGIGQLLDFLMKHDIPMAILSNKPDRFTKDCAAKFLGQWPFVVIQGAVPGTPHKPDPESVWTIARIMGIEPENLLYAGDSDVDMETAINARLTPVGVLWGFRSKEELLKHGAFFLVKEPAEIIEIFKKGNSALSRIESSIKPQAEF